MASSLKLRLLIAGAVTTATALALAGVGFRLLFEHYVEGRVASELRTHLYQLVAAVRADNSGTISVAQRLADPRFERPLSGLYWQIDANGHDVARSRSLWDQKLDVPTPPTAPGEAHIHLLSGPEGTELYSLEQFILIDVAGTPQPFVVTVGLDRQEIAGAVAAFGFNLVLALLLLGLALLLASWVQISVGLKPMAILRRKLGEIRSGSVARLAGSFPGEVEPLVAELNGLLVSRDEQLVRARQRAGDLAHGLKTPLTVLSAISNDLSASGMRREAADIDSQMNQMLIHIERELTRARMASGRAAGLTPVAPLVEGLVAAISRAPGAERIRWTTGIPSNSQIAVDRDDLAELLGNLLDNARKWARSAVRIEFAKNTLIISDDGPGIPEEKRGSVIERGVRLDDNVPGSGLGLSIARDIGELYGMTITLGRSDLGGLEVSIKVSAQI